MLRKILLSTLLASTAAILGAQQPPAPTPSGQIPSALSPEMIDEESPQVPEGEAPDDPWEAYGAGFFDRALQGFVDLEVEHPENPDVQLNLGSSYFYFCFHHNY